MPDPNAFERQQRAVARAMLGAFVTAIIVFGVVALAGGGAPMPSVAVRLQAALRADIFVVAWLAAAVANVARLRFRSERDIGGNGGADASAQVREAGAILQNTGEQVLLAVVVHLAFAATFVRSATAITALVVLFGIGRLLFWQGYRRGAAGRAFGFALTFYPTILALIATAVAIAADRTG